MLSLEILGCHEEGKVGIYVRDYACQGINPDYRLIAKIPRETGKYLVENNLINDLYGIFDKELGR